jgi:hypothetical protein
MKSYQLALALIDKPGRYVVEDPKFVPGDHVKLGFGCDPGQRCNSEWMYLEVTAVEGSWPDAVYRGELVNRPAFINPARLRVGQPVEFRAEHIYEVIHDSPDRPEGEREQPPSWDVSRMAVAVFAAELAELPRRSLRLLSDGHTFLSGVIPTKTYKRLRGIVSLHGDAVTRWAEEGEKEGLPRWVGQLIRELRVAPPPGEVGATGK